MDLESAQEAFVGLLGDIKADSKLKFLEWVHREYNLEVDGSGCEAIEEEEGGTCLDMFDKIREELRKALPPTAIVTGENRFYPSSSLDRKMDASNTLHVDAFLYPADEDIDSLCQTLAISRHYCLACGCWNTSPINIISHSVSKEQVRYIFKNLVPDLQGKTVIDIKSRIGPVLYGAYAFSQASKIYGLESNPKLCELQSQVVNQFNMGGRVEVVSSEFYNQPDLLQCADVLILNVVYEYFYPLEVQLQLWEFLYKIVRKRGTILITMPSLEEATQKLSFQEPLNLEQWVTKIQTGIDPNDEELGDIHMYCVL